VHPEQRLVNPGQGATAGWLDDRFGHRHTGRPGGALDRERRFNVLDQGRQVGVGNHPLDGEGAVVGVQPPQPVEQPTRELHRFPHRLTQLEPGRRAPDHHVQIPLSSVAVEVGQ
jgi:hypothetical protein